MLVDDRYVVDLWGYDYDRRAPTGVVDRLDPAEAGLIAALYGDPVCWEALDSL